MYDEALLQKPSVAPWFCSCACTLLDHEDVIDLARRKPCGLCYMLPRWRNMHTPNSRQPCRSASVHLCVLSHVFGMYVCVATGAGTGPAIIRYQVQQQYTTNAILVTLQQNRAELETLKRELHLPKAVFDAGFRIVQFVTLLTTRYDAGDTSPELQEMGEMAFFHLAGHLTPATESYPPARSTLVFALRELGKTFVIGHVKHQVHLFENIVQNTLHKTENVTLFLDLFQPDLSPEYIKLYYKASELASTGCTLVRNAVMSSSKGSSVCTRRHSVRGSRFCRRLLRHGVSQMCIDGWGALSGRNISAISLIALFVIWSLRGIVNGTHCFCGTYYFPVLPCRTPWWRVCCALTPTAGFSVTLDCRQKWSL
eukprot:m.1546943 g.1546943  ORF g.1546943 m.1546943 type:complete len:368 (-) comp25260_c0_seq91:3096-4199(-)